MKTIPTYRLLLMISIVLIGIAPFASAQGKKFKARVFAEHIKITNKESIISLSAKYKKEKSFEPASDLEFNVYKTMVDDSLTFLGKVRTDTKGEARFILIASEFINKPSSTIFNYTVKIENDSRFDDNETTISFSDANLIAEVQPIDSVNQIKATLTDASGKPIQGQPLKVSLQRMYAPLQIGEDNYETDENGSILVSFNDSMPGINGNLIFEVTLNESDKYGTVKAQVTAPIGSRIKDESTFDKRTLWSPPNKTPSYLLLFPSLIILGVWLPLLILVFNLYRISKS